MQQLHQWTLLLNQHEADPRLKLSENFSDNLKLWLSAEINNPNALCLIAMSEQQPVGFILANSVVNDNGFLASPLKGVIQLLWIDEAYRGKQLASQLTNQFENCMREMGVSYVECNYTNQNILAAKFWQSTGYEIASVTARKFLAE